MTSQYDSKKINPRETGTRTRSPVREIIYLKRVESEGNLPDNEGVLRASSKNSTKQMKLRRLNEEKFAETAMRQFTVQKRQVEKNKIWK